MACARLICRESTQNLMHKWALQCKQASQRFGSSTLVSLSLSLSLSLSIMEHMHREADEPSCQNKRH